MPPSWAGFFEGGLGGGLLPSPRMGGGLYFLGMSVVVAELVLAQSLLTVVGLGLVGVILTCALCIMWGLELFGLAVMMTYSSVFLFLSIFAVYLGGA